MCAANDGEDAFATPVALIWAANSAYALLLSLLNLGSASKARASE
jgi:hypothetical protein